MSLKPGIVSLVRFPRSDLDKGKYRPVVLLSSLPGPFSDWLICALTSQLQHKVEGWDGFFYGSVCSVDTGDVTNAAVARNENGCAAYNRF